jgi:hypothetical protein
MTEIILSLIYIFVFLILFNYPLNIFYWNTQLSILKIISFDALLVNIITHLNILLILSFFKINLNIIFLLELIIGILFFIYRYNKFIDYFKRNYLQSFFFIVICFLLFLNISTDPHLAWDGLANWFFKTQVYYQYGEYSMLKGLTYDYYPHLGSYIWAYFWKNSLINLEYFGRYFFIFFFVVTIFSLTDLLEKKFSINERFLISLVIIYLCTDLFLFGGYQEYLLFCFLYVVSRLFKILAENNKLRKIYILFFIILTNSLILWTKQEGFFYYIFLNLIFFIYFKIKFNYKILYLLATVLSFTFFIFIKINYYGELQFQSTIIYSQLINDFNISILLNKILIISKYFFISFFKYPIWLFIMFASFYLFTKTSYFSEKKFFIIFFLINTLFLFAIYIHTPYEVKWLVSTSLSRILFGLSGFYIILLVDFLNYIIKKKYKIF